jgi:hypothetical protein
MSGFITWKWHSGFSMLSINLNTSKTNNFGMWCLAGWKDVKDGKELKLSRDCILWLVLLRRLSKFSMHIMLK